jgi:Mycoplasma protein of unknown function, DUF285
MSSDATANNSLTTSTASSGGATITSTIVPRDHIVTNSILLEHADLSVQPVISDANFKTLVRHCLKSQDPTACDSMAHWDVSKVTNCDLLFWEPTNDPNDDWVLLKGADTFNVDISRWNVSSCTTMKGMFNGAAAFDQPIGGWNVHRVTDVSAYKFIWVINRLCPHFLTLQSKSTYPTRKIDESDVPGCKAVQYGY